MRADRPDWTTVGIDWLGFPDCKHKFYAWLLPALKSWFILLDLTTMSGPCLPAEVSDYIVDLLHDQPKTLGRCCLVSKSWVPRARKHLFAQIAFRSACDLDAWKETFPDSSNSPAHYARSLYFGKIHGIDSIITEDDCWTRAFCNVVKLELEDGTDPTWTSIPCHHLPTDPLSSCSLQCGPTPTPSDPDPHLFPTPPRGFDPREF